MISCRAAESLTEAVLLEPGDAGADFGVCGVDRAGCDAAGAGVDFCAEVADAVGEHGGALRGFAFPEGDAGRRAVRVFDEHFALRVDALDAPACVAEQDDVAGGAVDGEVLVERGDLDVLRLQHDGEERGVGDGAAVGDGDHACAAARMQDALHAVAEKVGAVAAARAFDAFVQQLR